MERSGTVLSPEKIWYNFKKVWWVGILILGPILAWIVFTAYKNYKVDLANAQKDMYQSLSTVYIDSEGENYTDSYKWLLYSQELREELNQALLNHGLEEFDKNKDIVFVSAKGESNYYELIVRSIGLERTQLLADGYTNLLVTYAKNIMGLRGRVIDQPDLQKYLEFYDGNYQTFELDQEVTVGFSAGRLVSWKFLMMFLAGVFLWMGVVVLFVLGDKTFRTKEEVDYIAGVGCLCEIGQASQQAESLLAVLVDYYGKSRAKDKFIFTSAMHSNKLKEIVSQLMDKSSMKISMQEMASVNADTVTACAEADYVILAVKLNEDKTPQVEKAISNINIVGANLIGYILIK